MGNPNPSPDTRFGAKNGNPSGRGKTSEQAKLDIESAEMAAKIRHAMLSEVLENVGKSGPRALEHIDPATLKLIKDSEDRAHGTPKQSVDHSSEDGSMTQRPTIVEFVTPKSDDESAG